MQLVIGLGARDIEIIGMDLGCAGHVCHEGVDVLPTSLAADYAERILPAFEVMHEALRGSGVAVRNHSPVCPLPRRLFAG